MADQISVNPGDDSTRQPAPDLDLDLPGARGAPAVGLTSGPLRTRWDTVAVVFLFGLLGNGTLLVLGTLAPKMLPALHVSVADYGNIMTVTTFIGIPAAIIAGYCSDRFGPRRTGVVSLVLSAAWNGLLPLFSGVGGLAANRTLFALGNSPIPIGNRALAPSIATRHRSICAAIFNFTFPVAQLILTVGGTAVIVGFSWQTLLYSVAIAGVIVAVFWGFLTPGRPPAQEVLPSRTADQTHEVSSRTEELDNTFKRVVTSRTLLGTGIAWGCSSWGFLFLVGFLPLYFVEDRHLGYLGAGLHSAWPWVGGVVGGFFVGLLSDRLLSRTKNYRLSRTYVAAAGQVIFAAGLCVAALSTSLVLLSVMLFIAEFANEMSASIFQVIAIDTHARRSGSASAMVTVVTASVGGWSSLVFGHLFAASLFTTAFLLAAIFPLIGAIALVTLVFPGQFKPWGKAGRNNEFTESGRQAF